MVIIAISINTSKSCHDCDCDVIEMMSDGDLAWGSE